MKTKATRWRVPLRAALVIAAGLSTGCDEAQDPPFGGAEGGGGGGGIASQFSALYEDYFAECGDCHAPGAPGRTPGIEQTLDFSTRQTAYTTITTGTASGLVGNQAGCNGVPFIGNDASSSLIVAAIHAPTRAAFDVPGFASCDASAISDMTLKVGYQPDAEFVSALSAWIARGAPND